MAEEWRDVVGYEGLYMVSDFGNVYSLRCKRNLRLTIGKRGYKTVSLFANHKRKEVYVHKLVATSFIENPFGYEFINHKDECKTNNHVSNLEWCTQQYNNSYGTARKKAANKRQKEILQLTKDGTLIKKWDSIKQASLSLGINHSNICQCCKLNKRFTTVGGYVWRYAKEMK